MLSAMVENKLQGLVRARDGASINTRCLGSLWFSGNLLTRVDSFDTCHTVGHRAYDGTFTSKRHWN